MQWQEEWAGTRLAQTGFLRCAACIDVPQPQLRTFILPPDPVPIQNPRPGEYATMVISSEFDNEQVSGALVADQAIIAGEGLILEATSRFGSGALTAIDAALIGTGTVGSTTLGSGSLVSDSASIAGVGDVATSPAIVGSGSLVAGSAAISGTGSVIVDGMFIGFPFGLTYATSTSSDPGNSGQIFGFPFGITHA